MSSFPGPDGKENNFVLPAKLRNLLEEGQEFPESEIDGTIDQVSYRLDCLTEANHVIQIMGLTFLVFLDLTLKGG